MITQKQSPRIYYTLGSEIRFVDLGDQEVIFGRGNDGVQIGDKLCSRRHASISLQYGQVVIRDLDSRNGTFVNEQRISTKSLNAGEIIRIGGTSLKILKIEQVQNEVVTEASWPQLFECVPQGNKTKFASYK